MVAVPPASATPVNTPVALTEATAALLLAHVPPDTGCPRADVLPGQTDIPPVIAAGAGSTVTAARTIQVVAGLV